MTFSLAEASPTWKLAIEVPGTATLNIGGNAQVTSISCGSAGNCSAGGSYSSDLAGDTQAFVVNESNGQWKKAIEVPGTAILNIGGNAQVTSISCGSAGNCSAGGSYSDDLQTKQVFVSNEVRGRWKKATEVPGLAAVNLGANGAYIAAISCGSAGNCSAGGNYTDSTQVSRAFLVDEVDGNWEPALQVSGTVDLSVPNDNATIRSISCSSAGNCAAGGSDVGGSQFQPIVVNEVNGIWQAAIDLSGKGTLRVGSAKVNSVSCSSAGNCSAGGDYASAISGGSEQEQAFVAKEVGGRWQSVIEVPGTSSLNVNFASEVTSISCGSVESCIAGGTYLDGSEHTQVFEVRELNGVWQSAIEVPGVAPLNDGGAATFSTVSCVSTNACSAGGSYTHGSRVQAFVVNEGR